KNLMVNSLLRYLPVHLIDYVVYHEIAHLKERKHNERFWKIIKGKYKDNQKMEEELFLYWFLVQERLNE
ncbi:MAG TPA: M48 family metallopeptidase, partial [Candidatus Nanoarchaeia archaeon]|nr:M48 family metallopeptidase [Candidatus Nanoarchaeia archaeon]